MEHLISFLRGAEIISKIVSATYGPYGGNVLIERPSGLIATSDGATVVREVGSKDRVQNSLMKVIKEACDRVENIAGDGTSTTALLTSELIRRGLKLVVAGHCPMDISSQLQDQARRASEHLYSISDKDLDERHIYQISLHASKGDTEVAKAVSEAILEVGERGNILVQKGDGIGIECEQRKGIVLDRGWVHPYGREHTKESEGCLVAVFKQNLSSIDDIRDCLETATQWPQHSLVIFSPRIQGDAMKTVLMNISGRKNTNLESQDLIPISLKTVHEDRSGILEDIAAVTGAAVVDTTIGHSLREFNPDWFGSCRKIAVSECRTEILSYPDVEASVDKRISELEKELRSCESDYDRDRLKERIASLDGGLRILKVGGYTPLEIGSRMGKVEDAVLAASSALRKGVLPGAGNALVHAAGLTDTSTLGGMILKEALTEPCRLLIESACPGTGSWNLLHIPSLWEGWDPVSKSFRSFKEDPMILDTVESVAESVISAAAAAGMVLTTEVFISRGNHGGS